MIVDYILGIDAGNEYTGYCLVNENLKPIQFGKIYNNDFLKMINEGKFNKVHYVAMERIQSYGMAVGKTVFDTEFWNGRFYEALDFMTNAEKYFIYRKDEKLNLCGSMKANDSNIRRALIDRFAEHDFKNGKGTKKNPDIFYGFKADIWSGFAIATTLHDTKLKGVK